MDRLCIDTIRTLSMDAIEGHTDIAFSEDVGARFLAYGWNVITVGDANDTERVAQAIEEFRQTRKLPTLIIVDSHIGFGAPHKQDTSAAHGEPLGGWDDDLPSFPADPKGMASREASGQVQNAIALHHPWLLGGAADLAPSTKTNLTFAGAGDLEAGHYGGRNLQGTRMGMVGFGASAPIKDLLTKFGFTAEAVVAAAKDQIAHHRRHAL